MKFIIYFLSLTIILISCNDFTESNVCSKPSVISYQFLEKRIIYNSFDQIEKEEYYDKTRNPYFLDRTTTYTYNSEKKYATIITIPTDPLLPTESYYFEYNTSDSNYKILYSINNHVEFISRCTVENDRIVNILTEKVTDRSKYYIKELTYDNHGNNWHVKRFIVNSASGTRIIDQERSGTFDLDHDHFVADFHPAEYFNGSLITLNNSNNILFETISFYNTDGSISGSVVDNNISYNSNNCQVKVCNNIIIGGCKEFRF
jgi:hypothetical protein